MGFSYLINIVQRGSASLARIADFLAQPAYEEEAQASEPFSGGGIELHSLTFAYPVYRDESARARANRMGIADREDAGALAYDPYRNF